MQANEDDDQLVDTVLNEYKYDSFSESDKLFVLTHTRYNDKKLSLCDVYQIECCERGNTDNGICWVCHRSCIPRVKCDNGFIRQKLRWEFHKATQARIIAPTGGYMALLPSVRYMDLPQGGNMAPLPSSGYMASLPRIMARPPAVRNVPRVKNPLWKYVITSDKVNCMKALLSRTPLYAIQKENIPPEKTWIKCGEWMQHILSTKKAKWSKSEVCRYHFDGEESSDESQLCAMSQIAFTMHAAELFGQCCKFNAVKCMEYLLHKAPHLIHMKAGSGDNRLALNTALLYASPITKVLLRKDAVVVVGKDDSGSTLAAVYMRQRCYHNDIRQATELLCHGNKDVISQFECVNSPGETLLHILYDTFEVSERPLPKLEDTVFCTKRLLNSAVDPTKNSFLGTALDALIYKVTHYCFDLIGLTNDVQAKKYALSVQTFSACVQILIPVFKGEPPGDYNLPSSLMDLATVLRKSICMELIRVFQLVLDNGLYFDIMSFISCKMCLTFPKPNPCSFCSPAVRLLFTFLCHQPDHRTEKRFLNHFLTVATPSISLFMMQSVCHASSRQQCVLIDCCFWEMFELIVQAGVMSDKKSDEKLVNPNTIMCENLNFITSMYRVHFRNGCFTIVQRFARVVKMGWIHCTSKTWDHFKNI